MTNLPKNCEALANPDLWNFALSLLILLGIVVSYIPQQIRIISRRSTEGLSPWFVLLGTVAGTCAISNILLLPNSRADIACCKLLSTFACTADLLGIFQIGTQWASFFFIMFLFLIFTPREPSQPLRNPTVSAPSPPSWKDAVIVTSVCLVHFILTLLISVIIDARFPDLLKSWATLLGMAGMICACIQYLPQIWTTWRLKHVGSLSIPMMCIQTPGGFIFALSLWLRLGWQGWSAWLVYIVLGSLQGCLLFMSVVFELRIRRENKLKATQIAPDISARHRSEDLDETDSLLDTASGEQAPLLANGNRVTNNAPYGT